VKVDGTVPVDEDVVEEDVLGEVERLVLDEEELDELEELDEEELDEELDEDEDGAILELDEVTVLEVEVEVLVFPDNAA